MGKLIIQREKEYFLPLFGKIECVATLGDVGFGILLFSKGKRKVILFDSQISPWLLRLLACINSLFC
jgi:hypothetical protein